MRNTKTRQSSISPHHLWLGVFAIWAFLLSGVLASWIGTPGVLQAWRLTSLLGMKQTEQVTLEAEIEKLETHIALLDKSHIAQEREIRRTLGYAGTDEIIFDFSASRSPSSADRER